MSRPKSIDKVDGLAYRIPMITLVGRAARSWEACKARFLSWEHRAGQRFVGWSVRRRWFVLVLLPTFLICAGGTTVGLPLAWVARETIEASQGAPSPDAAANDYLMALGYNNQDGLLAILDNDHQRELITQWRLYRSAMDNTSPPPSRLDFGGFEVGPVIGKRTEVTTEVSATWWNAEGPTGTYRSEARSWRFQTSEDNGWQVTAVQAPAWCGGYVRPDACK